MYNFRNDYSQGAHGDILNRIIENNYEVNPGYGLDMHCMKAHNLIEKELGRSDVDIHFISGGTQTNLLTATAFLKPYQSIIAIETAHILDNETGAIEATGHKIIEVKGVNGKLPAVRIDEVMRAYGSEAKTQPKMVYITNATETGTLYTLAELQEISDKCKQYGLLLYLDGARLAVALTAESNDISLKDIANYCDAFFIGGTKNGLIIGEALVIVNESLKPGFRYMYKQRGAMLAKGFFMGNQFEALFEDGLFYKLGRHANEMAKKLADGLVKAEVELYEKHYSNQIFILTSDDVIEKLKKDFLFEIMILPDGKKVVRFVTSWGTKAEEVDALIGFFNDVKNEK